MFEQFIKNSKETNFLVTFILLLIASCVAYSYNFQDVQALSDTYTQSSIVPFAMYQNISMDLHSARAFGWLLSLFMTDGSMSGNVSIFLNIVISAWSATYFIRHGMKINSIFWAILLACPTIINAAIGMHYNYTLNALFFNPAFLALSMFAATIVSPKKNEFILTVVILVLGLSDYQTMAIQYCISIFAIVIMQALTSEATEIKSLLSPIIKDKVIPAVSALFIAVIIYIIIVKLSVSSSVDGRILHMFDYSNHLNQIWQKYRMFLDIVFFNMYTTSLHFIRLIMIFLLLMTILGSVIKTYQRGWKISLFITTSIILLIIISPLLINIYDYIVGSSNIYLRVCTPYGVFISMLLYVIYIGFKNVKWVKYLLPTLSFIFVVQLANATTTQAYKLLEQNKARKAQTNRLFTDIAAFARAHKIGHKIPVYFIYRPGVSYNMYQIKTKHRYLHFADEPEYYHNYHGWKTALFYALGANDSLRIYLEDYQAAKKGCINVTSDKTMHKWPFYNSMKLINGVVYVKLDNGNADFLCSDAMLNSHWQERELTGIYFKDGYLDLSK